MASRDCRGIVIFAAAIVTATRYSNHPVIITQYNLQGNMRSA
jgi:hypothetical protein